MKLIYIQSLSRSGSTFLQQVLAAQAGMASLGEVERVLKNASLQRDDPYDQARRVAGNTRTHDKTPCSCGEPRDTCEFWSPLLNRIQGQPLADCYREMMGQFEAFYPGQVLIDSSKVAGGHLRNYVDNGLVNAEDVRVILLIRDFRAWCYSMQKWKKVRYATGKYPPGYHSYLADAYRWMVNNRRAVRTLTNGPVKFCIVSHERLVFQFEKEMSRILGFLGRDPGSLELSQPPQGHELFGSQSMKRSEGEAYRIAPRYDSSWMSDNRATCYGPILYPVASFNNYVHENLAKAA